MLLLFAKKSKTSWVMGKHHMEHELENHSRDQQYRPEHQLTDFSKRSHKRSSIWRNLSWLCAARGRNLERRHSAFGFGRFGSVLLRHPHRSETNCMAERAVRRVKEGTSAVLLQPGLDEKWWSDSMECYCYLRHVKDLLADGKTPYERRFGEPFKGPRIPFGAMVEYHPSSPKDQMRIHQLGKKILLGIFQ